MRNYHYEMKWQKLLTPEAVERLCEAYDNAIHGTNADPLLLIPMFILDFLCIHPFRDGNVTQRHLQKAA
ncbi:MAG: Fic family protein [Lachnospiraceae bacterium]|nr:Fic family protein [Lachnospiraceae bacterium]